MKVKFLKNYKNGKVVVDKKFIISEDGKYIRNCETKEKFLPYESLGYNVITMTINGIYFNQIQISRLMWQAWVGEIPEGWIIHHKEKGFLGRLNDHINNLECKSQSKHVSDHMKGNKYLLGYKASKETRAKQSQARMGNKNKLGYRDPLEVRLKKSKSHIGLKESKETRLKKSVAMKKIWAKRKETKLCHSAVLT